MQYRRKPRVCDIGKPMHCASAVFHPKLALLVAEDSARAVISSANLTRGGFERQRELGRVFDLGPSALEHYADVPGVLVDYLDIGVSREVKGDFARDLADATRALKEVLVKYKAPVAPASCVLLHNYAEPIWTQLLGRLPHRVLRRAMIVSLFEPDRKHPEDPVLGPQDASVFGRMFFEDFEFDPPRDESPVRVLFRQE